METHPNAELVRSIYEAWNRRDFEYDVARVDEGVEWTVVPMGTTFRGKDGYRQYLTSWATAFPDAKVEVVNVAADNEGAAIEFIGRGTQTGPLMGPAGEIPATGKSVEIPFCDVVQIRNGKQIRGRTYFDAATMMRQLGLIS